MGLQKLVRRLIGYIRIAILARILTPEQFGVFGIATLTLAFLEIFTETGINVFLIQEKENIDKYINTAWVISILRGLFIGIILLLTSGLISGIFSSPEAYGLLVLTSVVPILRGFINPSIIKLRKELKFNLDFLNESLIYISESIVIILVALIYKTEYSFIWGVIAGVVVEIVLSNILAKPRPRFILEIDKARKIIKRGSWVTINGIFNYLNQQGDDAIVGKFIGLSALGIYQNIYKISILPLTEITYTVANVTFSIYVKFVDDYKRVRRAFLKVLLVVTAIVIPIGALFFIFPEQIILVILGEAWLGGADVLRVLAIFGVLSAINTVPNSVFLSLKKQDVIAKLKIAQFVIMLFLIFPLIQMYQLLGAAYAVTLSTIVIMPFTFISLYFVINRRSDA